MNILEELRHTVGQDTFEMRPTTLEQTRTRIASKPGYSNDPQEWVYRNKMSKFVYKFFISVYYNKQSNIEKVFSYALYNDKNQTNYIVTKNETVGILLRNVAYSLSISMEDRKRFRTLQRMFEYIVKEIQAGRFKHFVEL